MMRRTFAQSRIRILKLALQEAVRAGDKEAAKRLTTRLAGLLNARETHPQVRAH